MDMAISTGPGDAPSSIRRCRFVGLQGKENSLLAIIICTFRGHYRGCEPGRKAKNSRWPTTQSAKNARKGTWDGLHPPSERARLPNRLFHSKRFAAFGLRGLLPSGGAI